MSASDAAGAAAAAEVPAGEIEVEADPQNVAAVVVKKGWLYREGKNKNWKRRWCVLESKG